MDGDGRRRVLEAAEELFCDYGSHAVRMTQVRDQAGVSLARLYKLYPSKHQLMAAYLRAHGQRLRAGLSESVERCAPAPAGSRTRLLAAFDHMQKTVTAPGFRGCAFVNARAELGGPGHERHPLVAEAVQEHKTLLRSYLTGLAGDFTDARGVGEQLHILIEGAMVTSSILGADAARPARDVACAALSVADGAREG
ncbi:TetR/AcrR family transcriptional regulator [Streptomyces paromomycinus]|uniref:TetR/AcrR family transcriptional regulator n=1 Tax=Streptomyces paromomycinus TaxID=92743 RepID=UPI001FE73D87|nr:TetR/AcrR family transcriptional regulator [Streptomyces paromomycinus]